MIPARKKSGRAPVSTKRNANAALTPRTRKRPTPARNPLRGSSPTDTLHNVASALAYLNVAEVPEHASEDVCFGRFLLVETVIHVLDSVGDEL